MEPKEKVQTKEKKGGQLAVDRPNGNASAYNGNNGSQVHNQSGNGSNGQREQWQIRRGPIIKLIRYGNMRFTRVLQDTVRNHRLSFGARGLLAYMLSQPPDWQPLLWQILQEAAKSGYKLSHYELSGWLRELREHGHARDRMTKDGRRWEVCEFPNQVWLGNKGKKPSPQFRMMANSADRRTTEYLKKDSGVSSATRVATETGAAEAAKHSFSDVPRLPFPKSNKAMYRTLDQYSELLERHDVNADPDRDGNFFKDFSARGWCYPSGRLVSNWLVAYTRRRQHIQAKMLEAMESW